MYPSGTIPESVPEGTTSKNENLVDYTRQFDRIIEDLTKGYANQSNRKRAVNTDEVKNTSNDVVLELPEMFEAYMENYTIGDLSKYIFAKNYGTGFAYCGYDMIDKLKKDLWMASLVEDPLSENTDVNYQLSSVLLEFYSKYYNWSFDLQPPTTRIIKSARQPNNVTLPHNSGGAPYERISDYNKYVQWNTLYGEFLHDFTKERIKPEEVYNEFGKPNGIAKLVSSGWEQVIQSKPETTDDEKKKYDYIRAQALYNAQPLNETKYVKETIKVIQNNNPELLYDLDYTPLTTFSTPYYADAKLPSSEDITEIYNKITKFFHGAIVIPRKKIDNATSTKNYCYVFYVFNPKPNEESYHSIQLQMTDMNIDQKAVNARLLYKEIINQSIINDPPDGTILPSTLPNKDYFESLFVHTIGENPTVTISTDNSEIINKAKQNLERETPTLETYAKGLDPITTSTVIQLENPFTQPPSESSTEIMENDSQSPKKTDWLVITQDNPVITVFTDIIQNNITNLQHGDELLSKYLTLINTYFTRTEQEQVQYSVNKDTVINTENENADRDIFMKLLLESFIQQATISSMNELLNIWFAPIVNINSFTRQFAVGNKFTDDKTKYNTIVFFKKTQESSMDIEEGQRVMNDTFQFQLGSTTVTNVAGTLLKIILGINSDTELTEILFNTLIHDIKSNHDKITKLNTFFENLEIDTALRSLVLYFLHNIANVHQEFYKINIISGILMFVVFAKSCGDELQRLTCEKINNLLGKPVFILTRDRIFVAKCLAELTPCVSTIILDQFNQAEDIPTEKDEDSTSTSMDITPAGGAPKREGSAQTRGGVLITRISALSQEVKPVKTLLKERFEKGQKVYNELNKRILAKLNSTTTTVPTIPSTPSLPPPLQIFIKTNTAEDFSFDITALETRIGGLNDEVEAIIQEINEQIDKIYTQNGRLTQLLDSLELYTGSLNASFSQDIIDAEIRTLALRLLSSSQKEFLKTVDVPIPINAKNLFISINTLLGSEDVTTKLLEIYTTATNAILTRIQESRANLELYKVADDSADVVADDMNTLYINTEAIEPITQIITKYEALESGIQVIYKKELDKIINKLITQHTSLVYKAEKLAPKPSNASNITTGNVDDDTANYIEDAEIRLDDVNDKLDKINNDINTDTEAVSGIVNNLSTISDTNLTEIDAKLNEFIQKYDNSSKILSSITAMFKGTKKSLVDKSNKLLKSIEKSATKQRKTFRDQITKLETLIAKKRDKMDIKSLPKPSTTILNSIITSAKDAYTKIKFGLSGKSTPTTSFGGKKRNNTRRNTLLKNDRNNRNNKRSNRRIRKIGVLTKKRGNKHNIILDQTTHKKKHHNTRRNHHRTK